MDYHKKLFLCSAGFIFIFRTLLKFIIPPDINSTILKMNESMVDQDITLEELFEAWD